jgi:hypothetical protein
MASGKPGAVHFAVYWRNCKNFLTGDGDQESIKAKKYVSRFKPSSAQPLENEINDLHYHVLHLSGKRTSDNEKKLALDDALKLMDWLEANMKDFEAQLGKPFAALWKPPGPAGPDSSDKLALGYTGSAAPPQATNHPTSIGGALPSGVTHTTHAIPMGYFQGKKPSD